MYNKIGVFLKKIKKNNAFCAVQKANRTKGAVSPRGETALIFTGF